MDKDLAGGPIGTIGNYSVVFRGGKLVLAAVAQFPPGESFASTLEVDAKKVLDALKAAIPGVLDDALIALAEKALGL